MVLQVREIRNFHTFLPILPLLVWPAVLASPHANSQTYSASLLLYCACLIDLLRVEDFGVTICVLNAQRANAANERGSLGLLRKKKYTKKEAKYMTIFYILCIEIFHAKVSVLTLMTLMERKTKLP